MRRAEGKGAAWRSASGPRPASAFVAIAVVLLAVTARAAQLAFVAPGAQPDLERVREAPWPRFEITDDTGRPLAVSVECFDLFVSPRAMWRSHTPDRMAQRLAAVLGEDDPDALLAQLCPTGPDGVRAVAEPRLLRFRGERLAAVDRWIQTGAVAPGDTERDRIPGVWLAALPDGDWTLEWAPRVLLSEETRRLWLGVDAAERPETWTRHLLTDLSRLVGGDAAAAGANETRSGQRARVRDEIWAELMDPTFRVVRRKLDPMVAHDVDECLRREAVSPYQMQVVPVLDRKHPVRPDRVRPLARRSTSEDEEDPAPAAREDAFALLGHWGVLGPEDALERARFERDRDPHTLEWYGIDDPVERRAWELETEWRPWSGLELLANDMLAKPEWGARLDDARRSYSRRMRNVSPDRRSRWRDRHVPNYFETARDASDVPRVECTIDATLQARVHAELVGALDEHRAAVAEAIVLDVATGDVLAVDGVYAYPISGFAPLRHSFTPGSTMKAVVMAIALDRGVVRPEDTFPTWFPDGIVLEDSRRIHEAEGAPTEERITARQALAESVNAVLVQIGMLVPAPDLRGKLVELGYGQRPGAGLGPEASGYLPPLAWRRIWEHASVAFGHELTTSLWQHAAALATIARGGVRLPLRLVRAVEQGEKRWELPVPAGERVLGAEACRAVRSMMAEGAATGTGRRVASPDLCPEFAYIGTKTGTTEKVPSEVSLHVEWPRQLELAAEGRPWSRSEYRALVGRRENLGIRSTCYTSSMCAIGRLEGGDRELLVLLVVDEPRSKDKKFGADIAGPAALRILRAAFGLPAQGAVAGGDPSGGASERERAARLPEEAFAFDDLPWVAGGGPR